MAKTLLAWQALSYCFIALLCLGVFLQMLGLPVTFWDLNGSDEDFVSALLMGVSIISNDSFIMPFFQWVFASHLLLTLYFYSRPVSFFRPPLAAF